MGTLVSSAQPSLILSCCNKLRGHLVTLAHLEQVYHCSVPVNHGPGCCLRRQCTMLVPSSLFSANSILKHSISETEQMSLTVGGMGDLAMLHIKHLQCTVHVHDLLLLDVVDGVGLHDRDDLLDYRDLG